MRRGDAASDESLTWANFGGSYGDALYRAYGDSFTEKTGIRVEEVTTPPSLARIRAQVESGNVLWDLAELTGTEYEFAVREDLLEPYDFDIIDTSKIPPGFKKEAGIEHGLFLQTMAWDQKDIPDSEAPQTWAAFFDPDRYPNTRRSVYEHLTSGSILEIALIGDGVPFDEVYPIDVERALRFLTPSLDRIIWHESNDQPIAQLNSDEVDLVTTYANRIFDARTKEDAQFQYTPNEGVLSGDPMVIPKGAPNKEAAMQLMNHILSNDEAGAEFARTTLIAPLNQDVLDLLEPEIRRRLPTSDALADQVFVKDHTWWVKNLEQVQPRFDEWQATGEV